MSDYSGLPRTDGNEKRAGWRMVIVATVVAIVVVALSVFALAYLLWLVAWELF